MQVSAVILAAGLSKRMKSALPKVLHPLLGRPMIEYSLENVKGICTDKPVVVIGHAAEAVKKVVGDTGGFCHSKRAFGNSRCGQFSPRLTGRKIRFCSGGKC